MAGLSEEEWAAYESLLGPLHLPRAYCPVEPTIKQEWFLRRNELEGFFGGSAGPGKSWALLMAALMYVDVEGYDALLLRPTLAEFEQPGALIDVAHDWLDATDAHWHGTKREWTFPSGATVRFGYLSTPNDIRQYQGPMYSFVGFDELTAFPENLYRAMSRVLRQPTPGDDGKGDALEGVPLRKRSASNPGGSGHSWVKSRFIDQRSRDRETVFVPASIHDNPHLDYTSYLKSLAHLSPIDQMRLIDGDWDVMEEGGKFSRDNFRIIDSGEAEPVARAVRYWDLAATEPGPANANPDYTVGMRMEQTVTGRFTVRHIVRGRWSDAEVERRVRATAEADGVAVDVFIEQEPGASGKSLLGYYRRRVLAGFVVKPGLLRRDDKEVRARPVAAAVANRLVDVVRGQHTNELLDEASIFPLGDHDDIVDTLSGAHTALTRRVSTPESSVSVPQGRVATIPQRGVAAARGSM